MAFQPVVKPLFPNVPNLPGVPALPRSPNFPPVVQAALGFGEGLLWQMIQKKPVWGIFDANNKQLVAADSVLTMGMRAEARISDFQIEQGSFATYNKVQLPDATTIQLTKGGTVADRTAFLASIDALKKGLALVTVRTPERSYLNVNVESYDYSARPAFMVVEIRLKEVRQVTAAYIALSNAQNPAAKGQANTGQVQPQEPSTSLLREGVDAIKNWWNK